MTYLSLQSLPGGPASWACSGAPHLSFGRSWFALCLFGPLQAGVALFVVVVGFFLFPFSPSPPPLRHRCVLLCVFSSPGCLGPGVLPPPPPFFSLFFCPPPLLSLAFLAFRLPGASAPQPFFFPFVSCFSFFRFFLPVLRCGAGLCVFGRRACPRLGGAVPVVAHRALAGVAWCSLLGLAVLCCLLVGLGVVLRRCCPCLATWLAALLFGVVCLGVPLRCVLF